VRPMRTRTAGLLLRLPWGRGPLWRWALDTVWQAWLGTPDRALWTLLEEGHRPWRGTKGDVKHQFRHDVALGKARGRTATGDYEIELEKK